MKFGYARISTDTQKIDLQIDALLRAGVEKENIYTDVSSGAKRDRPGFDKLLSMLRRGDEVIVWSIDRVARSVAHISKLMEGWDHDGIQFRSIQEAFLDTTSSHGKFVFTLFSAVAQLERDLIVERTKAGLEAAKKRGRKGGRPHGLSVEAKKKAEMCAKLYKTNTISVEEIMEMAGVGSKATFYKYLRHQGVEPDGFVPDSK
jgi:DNA invertase Pin-like site-specific DNA recombinase